MNLIYQTVIANSKELSKRYKKCTPEEAVARFKKEEMGID